MHACVRRGAKEDPGKVQCARLGAVLRLALAPADSSALTTISFRFSSLWPIDIWPIPLRFFAAICSADIPL
eukprot:4825234-Pyramimonas_sp.AAC.1